MSTWLGHRVPGYVVKYYSGYVWEDIPGLINIWIRRLSKADCLPLGWASADLLEAEEERIHFLCLTVKLEYWSLPLDWNWDSTGAYTIISPGSPACQLQTVGLLSLHYHVSQFLVINLSTFLYTYWLCFSGDPRLIHFPFFSLLYQKPNLYCYRLILLLQTKNVPKHNPCRASRAGLLKVCSADHCQPLLLVCNELRTGTERQHWHFYSNPQHHPNIYTCDQLTWFLYLCFLILFFQ